MREKRTGNVVVHRPVLVFYFLAFCISWLGWIPQTLHARGLISFDSPILAVLGGTGPTLAAVVVLLCAKDREALRNLFARLWRVRVAARWYAVAFGFWPLAAALALALGVALGQVVPAFDRVSWTSVVPVFAAMLFSNVWEEIGWRGYALPRLQERWPDVPIALVMGVLGWLWHIPLMLNPTSPMSQLPWFGELVFSIALSGLSIWLFRRTGGSLFFVSVFHAMANTVSWVLYAAGVYESSYPFVAGVTVCAALVFVFVPSLLDPERLRA
ncbi:MAG: CPBP family intramembrane glutamic endopeptidase [Rectinemataceae bacterium]